MSARIDDGAYTAAELAQDAADAKQQASARIDATIDELEELLSTVKDAQGALEVGSPAGLSAALRVLRNYQSRDGLKVGRGLIESIFEVL